MHIEQIDQWQKNLAHERDMLTPILQRKAWRRSWIETVADAWRRRREIRELEQCLRLAASDLTGKDRA